MRHATHNAPDNGLSATHEGAREQSATVPGVSSGSSADSSLPQTAPVASDGGRRLFARWTQEQIAAFAESATRHGIKRAASLAGLAEMSARDTLKRHGYRPVVVWTRDGSAPTKRDVLDDCMEYLALRREGLTIEQIATAKQVSTTTVSRKLAKARIRERAA